MNQLHTETSPYLLQHAQNPVYWKPWNSDTLQLAQQHNKLLLVSIGYSSCHWCHVMEHECFEDPEVAQVMNTHYISIKVDREERPDVDALYMKALQLLTGSGGWPLNVVCLPNGEPVWGATYLPKANWINALQQLQKLYEKTPEKLHQQAQQLTKGLQAEPLLSETPSQQFSWQYILSQWKPLLDYHWGGIDRKPKFMMPVNLLFLQAYAYSNSDTQLIQQVDTTLTRMAQGGIFDTIAGGFSRYSVDEKWHIPHFEKMLYDNAQLLSLYAQAYKRNQNTIYKNVIEKSICFIEQYWKNPKGGYYSSWDADSPNENGIWQEGAYYTWTKDQLEQALGSQFPMFAQVYNINPTGYWENQQYVFIQTLSDTQCATKLNITVSQLHQLKQQWETILYNTRKTRTQPRLDDKILTAWNALLITGLLDAYQALQQPHYLTLAQETGTFITEKLWSPEGYLYRNYKNNTPAIPAFLDDYACTIQALIKLFETSSQTHWLHKAKQLTDYVLDYFWEPKTQFFNYTPHTQSDLVAQPIELEDNVIPSSNSIMAHNLFRLHIYYQHTHYRTLYTQMLHHITPKISYPPAFANWLLLQLLSESFSEVTIIGPQATSYLAQVQALYTPLTLSVGTSKPNQLPLFNQPFTSQTQLYYCQQNQCMSPITCTPQTQFSSILFQGA